MHKIQYVEKSAVSPGFFILLFIDGILIEDPFVVCYHSYKQRADIISIPVSMHFSFI